MAGVDRYELESREGFEGPPAWYFTAEETRVLCTCVRRQRYPSTAWPTSWPTPESMDLVLDRLIDYLSARSRWEHLYLGDPADPPF